MSISNMAPETTKALKAAHESARRLGQGAISPVHLLIGVTVIGESLPASVMFGYGVHQHVLETSLSQLGGRASSAPQMSMFTDDARNVVVSAEQFATRAGQSRIDLVALTRALLTNPDADVVKVLTAANVAPDTILAALAAAAPLPEVLETAPQATSVADSGTAGTATAPDAAPGAEQVAAGAGATGPGTLSGALAKFGRDLTADARDGKLDQVIGRDEEIRRLQVVLGRRGKNSPCLVGEPGVGKSAVVEGLAIAIADGTAAQFLLNRPLVALDLAGMLSGAKMRGDFEERLKKTFAEAVEQNAILFLDEVHQIVGAGAAAGGLDVANLLKPMLARGELAVVGATTREEYRKHIESDPALERRFQPVVVEEPSQAKATAMLTQLAPVYAAHHGVQFSPQAIGAAVALSGRYIADRFLPDKAIDVLDEAAAAAGMRMFSAPQDIRATYKQRFAVRRELREADSTSPTRAAELRQQDSELTAAITAAGPDLGQVGEDEVAAVIAMITGVPVTAVGEAENRRLREMPARLKARVIGQDDAVDAVARAVTRRRQGVSVGDRPSSFIFAGQTGVGKTELAKALAEDLFGEDATGRGAFVHIDMSEFAEKSSVSRLVGAPPGYTGYEDAGHLTEKVRRNPYAVLLFDEVEKAHPEVFDTLLSILEDGRLTDGHGRTVDFRNVTIILTTNLGAAKAASASLGFAAGPVNAAADSAILAELRGFFRPEFLNRIDEIVIFRQLTREQLNVIVETMLALTRQQLSERDITLDVTPAAVAELIRAGYDPKLGARPLRRAIQNLLVDPLSMALLAGDLHPGQHAVIDALAVFDDEPLAVLVSDRGPAPEPAVPLAALR